jgi:hypothetical protein
MEPVPSLPKDTCDGNVVGIAERNVRRGHELSVVSGEVIARRMAMGVTAMLDPANADQGELARLVPEKSEAISASGMAMLEQSGPLAERVTRFAVDEVLLAARAWASLASCRTPGAFVMAHQGLTFSWLVRMMAQGGAISAVALQSQGDALTPFRSAATANAERLGRG